MPVQGNEAFSGQGLEIRSPLHCGPSRHQEEFGSFQVTALTHLIGARQVLPVSREGHSRWPWWQWVAPRQLQALFGAAVWGRGGWTLLSDLLSGLLMDRASAWWVEQKHPVQFRCSERSPRRDDQGEQLRAARVSGRCLAQGCFEKLTDGIRAKEQSGEHPRGGDHVFL